MVSKQNSSRLKNVGDRTKATLIGLSNNDSAFLIFTNSERSTTTFGYKAWYLRRILGKTSCAADGLKPISRRPLSPLRVLHADWIAFSAWRRSPCASSRKT